MFITWGWGGGRVGVGWGWRFRTFREAQKKNASLGLTICRKWVLLILSPQALSSTRNNHTLLDLCTVQWNCASLTVRRSSVYWPSRERWKPWEMGSLGKIMLKKGSFPPSFDLSSTSVCSSATSFQISFDPFVHRRLARLKHVFGLLVLKPPPSSLKAEDPSPAHPELSYEYPAREGTVFIMFLEPGSAGEGRIWWKTL